MGQSIAVMNTKGGVGKSTTVMALAETLAIFHGKTVLVIDSDSQASISTMLMPVSRWETIERQQHTLVDYLSAVVLAKTPKDWKQYVASGVSDVDDVQSIYLMPSHMELSLFEREVSAEKREAELRAAIRMLLDEAKRYFDVVLVDCPPGLSVVTECWVREADHFLPPTKPDYLSARGLTILRSFRERFAEQGFANLLGVLITMKDPLAALDEEWHRRLAAEPLNRVFQTAIPRRAYLQRAADFDAQKRSYGAKYPGDAGQSLRLVTEELLARLHGAAWMRPEPKPEPPRQAVPAPVRRAEAPALSAASLADDEPIGDDDVPMELGQLIAEPAVIVPVVPPAIDQPIASAPESELHSPLDSEDDEPIALGSGTLAMPPQPVLDDAEPLTLPETRERRIAIASPERPPLPARPLPRPGNGAMTARITPPLPADLPIRRVTAGAPLPPGARIRRLVRPELPTGAERPEPPTLDDSMHFHGAGDQDEPIDLPAVKAAPPRRDES